MLPSRRLPHVGTDLLITVNVPYSDEDAAASSMATAECFLATAAGAAAAEASPVATPAPAVADDAGASSSVAADTSQEAARAAESSVEEGLLGGDGVVGAPQRAARDEAGTGAAVEGGQDGRELSSGARGNDCDAGVEALRPLLHSFAILDWSLFG